MKVKPFNAVAAVGGVFSCTLFTMSAFAALVAGAAVVEPKATDEVLCNPGIYTLAVSVGRKDGKPEIALPLEGGIDRIYPVGKIEVVSKMRGRQFTE